MRRLRSRLGGMRAAWARLWARTDRLVIAPHDLRIADATLAAEIYGGRFVFAGKVVVMQGRSVFAEPPPSDDWEAELLGFGWLRHMRAADSANVRAFARTLAGDWMARKPRRRSVGHRADVAARRLISFLSQAPLVVSGADDDFYFKFLEMLGSETRRLRYASQEAFDGMPRLQVRIALCYAALCLGQQDKQIRSAAQNLSNELQRQILPDGGHIARNPGALVELLVDLLPLRQTFAARNIAPPQALLNAIDRMMPMLRFFRHGDGSFAMFNGMSTAPSHLLAALLAYDDSHGTSITAMPHSGFQRIDAGFTTVIIDAGAAPPPAASRDAHAGCLSFELSSGLNRIVVNCGMPLSGRDNWRGFARSTPAHSTLTYRDSSSCQFVETGFWKRLLGGAPILEGPVAVESFREILDNGVLLTLGHDGYASRYGILHRRVLLASSDGSRLDGEDSITAAPGHTIKGPGADFTLHFHLHPSIKVSERGDGRGVHLALPNRDIWVFEALDDPVTIEDSVFLAGSDGPRKSSQLVIRQDARIAASIRWRFSRSGPALTAATRGGVRRGTSQVL